MAIFIIIAVLVAVSLHITASTIPTISTKGSRFFTADGNQFLIKGIRYDRGANDCLANAQQCHTDAALMKNIGLNSIRIVERDFNLKNDHSGCMSAFADNGIYAWIHLEPEYMWDDNMRLAMEGNNSQPWNKTSLQSFEKIIDEFQRYPNTAGFFVGNAEKVIASSLDGTFDGNSTLATYLKAAIHDTKAYRDSKGYRNIPIGYSDVYHTKAASLVRDYLTCGKKVTDSADFYSFMLFDGCYSDPVKLINEISKASVPVFISRLSQDCRETMFNGIFGEFGNGTDNAWSGGIVSDLLYGSWLRGEGIINYDSTLTLEPGVYTVEPTASISFGKPTPLSNGLASASSQWGRVANITGVKIGEYTPKATTPACPTSSSPAWNLTGDVKLPTLIDRAESTSTGAKNEATPTNRKKNGANPLRVDRWQLYVVLASLMGLSLGL